MNKAMTTTPATGTRAPRTTPEMVKAPSLNDTSFDGFRSGRAIPLVVGAGRGDGSPFSGRPRGGQADLQGSGWHSVRISEYLVNIARLLGGVTGLLTPWTRVVGWPMAGGDMP